MKKKLKIIIGRTSFSVKLYSQEVKYIFNNFNKQFQTYRKDMKGRRFIVVRDKLYVTQNEILKEYYYPKTVLNKLAKAINAGGIGFDAIDLEYKNKPKRYKIDLKFIFEHPLRPYQSKYVKTMTKSLVKNHTFLVDLQTGKGKGLIACKTISDLSYRTALLILPKYINKWKIELCQYYDITEEDIYVVQGSDSLRDLMTFKPEDIPKFVIFSNRTMQMYISKWETTQFEDTFEYDVLPTKLLDKLNISIFLVDEAHQEFHSVYKTVLALDPTLLLGLSATLIHNDKKINKIYELLYPKETRLSFLALDKYQHIIAIRYSLPLTRKFKYVAGNYGYSQTKFEESIFKSHNILDIFTTMLSKYIDDLYVSRKTKGQKCLVFFGSVNMCTYYTEKFNNKYKKLKVSRYVSGDSYDEMMESDIIFSTPGSSGTALDIPGLITVLSPVATGSTQLNLQMLGRLRKIEDVDVIYAYFHCAEIEQHTRYHDAKVGLFSDRVKRYEQRMYFPR